MAKDACTCVYCVLGLTSCRNCFVASVEFKHIVYCNLIGSDRFLLVHSKPWQVLPDIFPRPLLVCTRTWGNMHRGKIRLVYETISHLAMLHFRKEFCRQASER